MYMIYVSFDTSDHYGEYLTFYPFYNDVNSGVFSSSWNVTCSFLNDDGPDLTMPLIRGIDYLQTAKSLVNEKVYDTVALAETYSGNTTNPDTSCGGGNYKSFTTLWVSFGVFIIARKKDW